MRAILRFLKDPFTWAVLAFCVIVLAVFGTHFWNATNHSRSVTAEPPTVHIHPLRPDDHITGNPNGSIRLFLYMDTECPYCKDLQRGNIPRLIAKYGKIFKIIYRDFPIPIHPPAFREEEAVECAYQQKGDDGYFKFIAMVYHETTSKNEFPEIRLHQIAREIGLNGDTFDECYAKEATKARVQRDLDDAQSAGFEVTPSVVIEGGGKSYLVEGNYYSRIAAAVDAILHSTTLVQ